MRLKPNLQYNAHSVDWFNSIIIQKETHLKPGIEHSWHDIEANPPYAAGTQPTDITPVRGVCTNTRVCRR